MCFVHMRVGPLPPPWGAWGAPRWRPLGILDRGIPELSPWRCWRRSLDPSRELLSVGSPRPRPFLELWREQLAPGTNQPDTSIVGRGVSPEPQRRLFLEDGHFVRWAPGDAHGLGGPLTPWLLEELNQSVRLPFLTQLAGRPDEQRHGDRGPHPRRPFL